MNRIILLFALLHFVYRGHAQNVITGTITSIHGKTFVLKTDSIKILPVKGDSCYASKDLSGSTNPFGIKISSGWMGVAKTVVTGIDKNKITFFIVKETSNIVINGKKAEHFLPGKRFKLEWK